MSNHYHIVLYLDHEACEVLSTDEVIDRWHKLFKGTIFSQKAARGDNLSNVESKLLENTVTIWRERLMDISWFMRQLNESIARMANYEDNCTGRFWEGRFKSQALLDEKALAACLAYVDLNPIRAKMSASPEQSDFTSVKKRAEKAKTASIPNHKHQQPKNLMPFVGNLRQDMPKGLPFKLTDYLTLVDETGKVQREDKRGAISQKALPILGRLGIDPDNWLELTQNVERDFQRWVGSPESVEHVCEIYDLAFVRRQRSCKVLLS